jgi:uncharacterized protein (DUF4415 family)
MNSSSSPGTSETDWARIDAMSDQDIDFSDIPEITEEQIRRAKRRFGGVEIAPGKRPVQVLLDESVVNYLMASAGGRNYHALVNAALSEYMLNHPLNQESA